MTTKQVGGKWTRDIIKSHTPGGQLTNWRIIILQRFSYRGESSEAHVGLLSPEIPEPGKGTPRASGFEGQGDNFRGPTGLREIETSLLKGAHKVSHAPGARAKGVS